MTLPTKLKILNWVAVFLHFCSACTVLVFLITGRDVVYHLSYTTTTWYFLSKKNNNLCNIKKPWHLFTNRARCTESFAVAPVLFYGDGFSAYYTNMQSQYVKATCDSDEQCISKHKKEFDQSMQLDIAWAGYQNCDENLTSLAWGPNSATLQCESQNAPKVTNEKTTDAEQIRKLAREKMTTSLYCNSGLWVTQNFSSSDDQELMKLSTKLQSSSQISVSLAGSIGSFFLLSALFQVFLFSFHCFRIALWRSFVDTHRQHGQIGHDTSSMRFLLVSWSCCYRCKFRNFTRLLCFVNFFCVLVAWSVDGLQTFYIWITMVSPLLLYFLKEESHCIGSFIFWVGRYCCQHILSFGGLSQLPCKRMGKMSRPLCCP